MCPINIAIQLATRLYVHIESASQSGYVEYGNGSKRALNTTISLIPLHWDWVMWTRIVRERMVSTSMTIITKEQQNNKIIPHPTPHTPQIRGTKY